MNTKPIKFGIMLLGCFVLAGCKVVNLPPNNGFSSGVVSGPAPSNYTSGVIPPSPPTPSPPYTPPSPPPSGFSSGVTGYGGFSSGVTG